MDIAIMDCGYNYGYNLEVMFPVTNVSEAAMNQITYHKYWAVSEAPTFCTNRGFHEYYTVHLMNNNTSLFIPLCLHLQVIYFGNIDILRQHYYLFDQFALNLAFYIITSVLLDTSKIDLDSHLICLQVSFLTL